MTLKKHRLTTRPKSVECAYCEYASEGIADKPHYPAPLGTAKWILRLMNMHRCYSEAQFYNGNDILVCLTCRTLGGERKNWPCDNILAIAHGLNDEPEKETKESELRALGVIATGKNLV